MADTAPEPRGCEPCGQAQREATRAPGRPSTWLLLRERRGAQPRRRSRHRRPRWRETHRRLHRRPASALEWQNAGVSRGAPVGRGPPTPLGATRARVIAPRAAPRTQASSLSRGSTLKGSSMTRAALTTGKGLAGLLSTTARASGAAGAAGAGSGAPLALRFRVWGAGAAAAGDGAAAATAGDAWLRRRMRQAEAPVSGGKPPARRRSTQRTAGGVRTRCLHSTHGPGEGAPVSAR